MTDSIEPAPPGRRPAIPPADEEEDSLSFEPVPVRYRHDGWTPDRQLEFIQALADCGCVDEAARRVGMSRNSACALRRRPEAQAFRLAPAFAEAQGHPPMASANIGTIRRAATREGRCPGDLPQRRLRHLCAPATGRYPCFMTHARDIDRIVFGCGNFGGIGSSPGLRAAGDGEERALALLDHARRVGLWRFDTANTYGGGASEIVLGTWLRSQGASFRARAQIATKVGNPHGCPPGDRPLSRGQIAHHLDGSLCRLGIERIDLYYIHEFDRVTPLEEALGAMARAVEAGKIDRFGISNAALSDVEAVMNLAGDSLGTRFEYVQNEYNLLATGDAAALIPYCAGHKLRYTAFSPLAGGFLSGKYRFGAPPPSGSRLAHAPEACAGYSTETGFAAIERLRQSAEARGQSMAAAALRFVLDTPGLDGLVIAPRRVAHFASLGLEPE
jgi:aryl-alcohol dehydrogenase-like predicted oxidoreductase